MWSAAELASLAGTGLRSGQEAFYGTDDPGWIVRSECDLRAGGLWTVTFGPNVTSTEKSSSPASPPRSCADEHGRGVPNAFDRLERAIRASGQPGCQDSANGS